MFESIRKHQSRLWIVIGFLVILSFVWYFLPNQGAPSNRDDYNLGKINGKAISRNEYVHAAHIAKLGLLLQFGPQVQQNLLENFLQPQQVYQRLFLKRKLEEFNIEVSTEAMAQIARDRLQSLQRFGITSYDDLVKKFLPSRGFTAGDFNDYARQEAGIQHLASVVGITGKLVTPQEAEREFRRMNEEVTAQVAAFTTSNFLASVKVTPQELSKFYTNQMSAYFSAPKVSVEYVTFLSTNYLKEADEELAKRADLPQLLEQAYAERGTNSFKGTNDVVLSAEEAKAKLKQEFREQLSLATAQRKAAEYATEVFDATGNIAEAFAKQAQAAKLPVQKSAPFSQEEGPKSLLGEDANAVAEAAFELNAEEPVSRPVRGKAAVYVLNLKEKIPSAAQPFETVKEKVTEDFKKQQSEELTRQAGIAFQKQAAAGLSQGKKFEALAADAKLKLIPVGPLSEMSAAGVTNLPPHITVDLVREAVSNLPAGKISEYTPTSGGGFVLHVTSKTPMKEEKLKSDFPEYLTRIRRGGESRAFSDWVNHEFQKWLRDQPSSVQRSILGDRREQG